MPTTNFNKFLYNLKLVFTLGLFGYTLLNIALPLFTYLHFSEDIISKEKIMNRNNTGVVLLDRMGEPFFRFHNGREPDFTPLENIPKDLQEAIISVEDKDFYRHPGYSLKAMAAAIIADIRNRRFAYGGSTITQQLVKNALVGKEKSLLRKYQEILLAAELERRFNKKEILEMYLNSVYFGEGAYGVGQAYQIYFGKNAENLTLAESDVLAALPVAPSELSPFNGNSEKLKQRSSYVLSKMYENGFISKIRELEARQSTLKFNETPDTERPKAPHFAFMVLDRLIDQFGEEKISRSGFRVYTTLNLDWQKEAERELIKNVNRLGSKGASNGAVVIENPLNGEIPALVGSVDWNNEIFGKFNAALALRQPGSAFKPIVYIAALEKGSVTPASILADEPITYKLPNGTNYKPVNFDRTFRGRVLVRRALANSLNVPSIHVLEKVGLDYSVEMAKRFGISTIGNSSDYGLSFVLGAAEVSLVELTNAYAAIANGGFLNQPTLYTRIDNKYGETVFINNLLPEKIVDERHTFLITSILSDKKTRQEEFGNALDTSLTAAVKTGTSNDFRDSWTVGYSPSLAVGVWIGNNNNRPMDFVAGSLGTAPIWKSLITRFSGPESDKFKIPSGIVKIFICKNNGLAYRGNGFSPFVAEEYFIEGTEPKQACLPPTPAPSPETSPTPSPPPDKDNQGKSNEKGD